MKPSSAVAKATKNERFAWDCYRRFIQMYGDVVMGVQKRPEEDHEPFETVIHELKHERHHKDIDDTKDECDDLKELVARFKNLVKDAPAKQFPNDPWEQLRGSHWGRVWFVDERSRHRLSTEIQHPSGMGHGRNVQAMVFGNTGDNSGSGVAFTRDPATGEKVFYGEFLINAQGEDVVAGVRTPEPVADLKKHLPKALVELERIRHVLEAHFKDVQDFEFTIQDGKVFMLQTRNGKRTGVAAVKFACDMVREKLIEWKTAITRVPPISSIRSWRRYSTAPR